MVQFDIIGSSEELEKLREPTAPMTPNFFDIDNELSKP
jgi:hypothetical protein